MSVKAKYQPVLDLGEELDVKNGDVNVEGDILKIKGMTKTQYEKTYCGTRSKKLGARSHRILKRTLPWRTSPFTTDIP